MSRGMPNQQPVSVIGPSDLATAARRLEISVQSYEATLRETASQLARWPVTLIVNGESESPQLIAGAFLESGGRNVRYCLSLGTKDGRASRPGIQTIALPPMHIPFFLVREAVLVVCVGFGTGTLLEICLAKFESAATVLILNDLISGPLPSECNFNRLHYVDGMVGLEFALSKFLRQHPLRRTAGPAAYAPVPRSGDR